MKSLTQDEASERAVLLTVERYDVAVDLTELLVGSRVRTSSTITFGCAAVGASTFVDCAAEVVSATLNGVPLPAAVDERIALTNLAESNVLSVVTVLEASSSGHGLFKAVDPADGTVYAFTDFTPDRARYVWACFDQPDLKAPWVFTVTAPADWRVLSNSGEPQIEDLGPTRRWTFPPTPPLATYNTVINAGPYYEVRRTGAGHDLGLFARPSLASILDRDADELFTLTIQGMEFFAGKFGMPFPQHKYDQVFTPEFPGAMENYGCITWMDWFLRRTTPTRAEWDIFSRYLLHELAHMWFGNIVTMRWWDDLWLNEAFAEFASNWAAVNATSYTDAWTAHLAGEKLKAYFVDQGPTTHPIRPQVHDVSEAEATFDAITYPKGASVLQQLMTYVGEDRFSAALTSYFVKHAWGNTTLEDLIDAVAVASGRDLDEWRIAWLETPGTDRLTLAETTLVARGPGGGLPRPQVVAVGAYFERGGRLEREAIVEVEVVGERTQLDLPPGADLYLLNDQDLTFASTRPSNRDTFFTDAARLPTPISRAVAVATAWDMLINAEASAAEAVHCLLGVLAVETSASTIEPYLNLALEAADLWSPPSERDALMQAVAEACRSLADLPAYRKAALRGIARTAVSSAELDLLKTEDLDLQWRRLVRLAQLGEPTSAEAEALLERDPDPEAWVNRLHVRAATPDASEKEAVWHILATERTVPIASVYALAMQFWSAGQDDLLKPYAEAFLNLVPTLHRGEGEPAKTYTRALFPIVGADETIVTRAETLALTAPPVVRTNLLDRADRLKRMLRSRTQATPASPSLAR
ncbi:aminopeptidase N [Kribbella sp. NPDC006257]|uniref:aminopeptidase N n=1 Tax=Kribbella sp. NPDC006257 TaxID=3156738 RepID=UPI0033A8AAB9